jgi:hypothetical protein
MQLFDFDYLEIFFSDFVKFPAASFNSNFTFFSYSLSRSRAKSGSLFSTNLFGRALGSTFGAFLIS